VEEKPKDHHSRAEKLREQLSRRGNKSKKLVVTKKKTSSRKRH
jgi:hypothetical protein